MFAKKDKPGDPIDAEAVGHVESAAQASDAELARLTAERDELLEKYQRSLADFRNYQQRALQNERESRRQGQADVVASVIRILDFFELALGQDPEKATAAAIIGGVGMIRDELLRSLTSHGVSLVEPRVNEEFDPLRHQAVQQMAREGVEPGHVSQVMQTGYAIADRVLRPAKVAVAPREDASHDAADQKE